MNASSASSSVIDAVTDNSAVGDLGGDFLERFIGAASPNVNLGDSLLLVEEVACAKENAGVSGGSGNETALKGSINICNTFRLMVRSLANAFVSDSLIVFDRY